MRRASIASVAAACGSSTLLLLLTAPAHAFVLNVNNPLQPRTAAPATASGRRYHQHHHAGGVSRRPIASSSTRRRLAATSGAAQEVTSMTATKGTPYAGQSWLVEERDACGVGFIANPRAEHKVVELGLSALGCMEHRGACLADNV